MRVDQTRHHVLTPEINISILQGRNLVIFALKNSSYKTRDRIYRKGHISTSPLDLGVEECRGVKREQCHGGGRHSLQSFAMMHHASIVNGSWLGEVLVCEIGADVKASLAA